jgi:hypothetical protein
MTQLIDCLGFVAPYYNLIFVGVVIILFIIFLKNPSKKIYTLPWTLLFLAILTYVVEEILTVLNDAHIIIVSKLVAPLLEMIMISLFIYTLLLQKEYLKKL